MSELDMRMFARNAGVNVAFPAGSVVFNQGDPGNCMYIVQSGVIEMTIGDKVIEVCGPNEAIGFMSMIDTAPRSSTARVKDAVELSIIDQRKFRFMVDEVPNFALYIMGAMARRIRGMGRAMQVACRGLAPVHSIAAECDVVLSASIDESLPQTLAGLMRMGLIGVACLSGGIDELIEDGRTGYLTNDCSLEGLADVLERAIRDRDNWPAISARARQRIEQDHSLDANTGALLNLMIEGAQLESTPYGRLAPSG